MDNQQPQTATTIEEDLVKLEAGLRRLKVQYDMFFAGALPREPFELRREMERLMKRHAHANIKKYEHRFQLQALVARYNLLTERWGKTLRTMEEGERPAPAVAPRADRREGAERLVASYRLADPGRDEEALRKLHAKFVEARGGRDAGAGSPSFEKFVRGVSSQARRIRESSGCEQVELRVVRSDGKIVLKARPAR